MLAGLALAAILPACSRSLDTDVSEFTSRAWADAEPRTGARMGMLDDLLVDHLRIGGSMDRVVELLGTPDRPEWNPTWPHPAWVVGEYDLFLEPGSTCVLLVVPDSLGRVRAVWSPALDGDGWFPSRPPR